MVCVFNRSRGGASPIFQIHSLCNSGLSKALCRGDKDFSYKGSCDLDLLVLSQLEGCFVGRRQPVLSSVQKPEVMIGGYTNQYIGEYLCQPARIFFSTQVRRGISNKWEYIYIYTPSGKHTKSYRKSPCLLGKSTINGNFQ